MELCRRGLQSRSKQLEAGESERGTGWIRVETNWTELSLIPDVTTEVATIFLFRIQQSSDKIQRSAVMEVVGFLEPQLVA